MKALGPERLGSLEERVTPLAFMPGKGMAAADYVLRFTLHNFYFHATTAYSILRQSGVDLGKVDFLGDLGPRDI